MDKNEALLKAYEDLGKRWLAGEQITSFGKFVLNEKQIEFVNNKDKELLICGGFRSGKTIALAIKLYLMAMMFPNNRLLLGRKTKSDIESATLPALWDVFPPGTYEYKVGPGIIQFPNGSQILLYGLDMMVSGDDTKKSAQKIKGLDLGGVFIDQLEEVESKMVEILSSRLSRDVPFHQMASTTNPANFWAYDYFKANPRKGTHLIETGMKDNEANLPDGFIETQLEKGEMYVKRYVYGEWSPDTLVEGTVFPEDLIKRMAQYIKEPIDTFDGIKIFKEPTNHTYQIGVDPSTGSQDPCHICVIDVDTGEEVANYSGFVPIEAQVERTVQLAMKYTTSKKPLIIPEITGVGQSYVDQLKKVYDKIYEREIFNHRERKQTKKLGFSTNYATKMQLIEHFKMLLSKGMPKIRDRETYNEFLTFVYSDEAQQKGAGAQSGFHDDRVMAKLLGYWNVKPVSYTEQHILSRNKSRQKSKNTVSFMYN